MSNVWPRANYVPAKGVAISALAGQYALPEYLQTPPYPNLDMYKLELNQERYANYPFKWWD